jgi:hypothetical protein
LTAAFRREIVGHDLGRVSPSQTVADDIDYAADHATVIEARSAVGLWKAGFDALKWGLC